MSQIDATSTTWPPLYLRVSEPGVDLCGFGHPFQTMPGFFYLSAMKLHDLRQQYRKGGLSEQDLPDDPVDLLNLWITQAIEAGQPEPNAIALATVALDGSPDVRVVLIKDVRERSFTFFTNYDSVKGRQLDAHPAAAGSIWWDHLERQVRLRGPVRRLSREESADYFHVRPRESRLGAWASRQSETVSDRQALERAYREAELRYEGVEVPLPDFWGGYEVVIDEIEFWQGRPSRLHDRIRYSFDTAAEGWTRRRLSP